MRSTDTDNIETRKRPLHFWRRRSPT